MLDECKANANWKEVGISTFNTLFPSNWLTSIGSVQSKLEILSNNLNIKELRTLELEKKINKLLSELVFLQQQEENIQKALAEYRSYTADDCSPEIIETIIEILSLSLDILNKNDAKETFNTIFDDLSDLNQYILNLRSDIAAQQANIAILESRENAWSKVYKGGLEIGYTILSLNAGSLGGTGGVKAKPIQKIVTVLSKAGEIKVQYEVAKNNLTTLANRAKEYFQEVKDECL